MLVWFREEASALMFHVEHNKNTYLWAKIVASAPFSLSPFRRFGGQSRGHRVRESKRIGVGVGAQE
jgi:hypothetical protein